MRKCLKLALTGALCGAVFATTLPTEVLAGPMSAARPDDVALSAPVDKVWYRRYGGYGYRGGYYRRGNAGAAVAAGLGLGLLGAGLAASSGGYGYGGGYYPYGGYYGAGYGGGYGYYPSYYGGYGYAQPYYGGYYGTGWGGW